MKGIWLKKCPRCGTYIMKKEPEESVMCCACGWEEHNGAFFCQLVNNYCSRYERPQA